MDIFDLIGPVMVGPSSSHTAGAVRIGLVAYRLLGRKPVYAKIGLHGSFAATGLGHGTDRAIVAGLLGMDIDDERIPDSFYYARECGLRFSIEHVRLRSAHPNSASVVLEAEDGGRVSIVAASVGGGKIEVRLIDGIAVSFSADCPTIIVRNRDHPGNIAHVSAELANNQINIATFRVNRSARGGDAIMIIECDAKPSAEVLKSIRKFPGIIDIKCLGVEQ